METFQEELNRWSVGARGVLVAGDINVHQRSWLKFSSRGDTPMGKMFYEIITAAGLKQMVKEPTRAENLLDLVITDLLGTTIEVGGKVQDHKWIVATVPIAVPTTVAVQRQGWN